MQPSYVTIKKQASHEITIQKSRFISHFKHTTTESEAQTFITEIKKQYANANHNCSAYIIGENNDQQKANDDGEPSGTAGVPMLEVLKKKNLRNITVVVTRFFGGIKLGAGGLIRAYSHSVSDGIVSIGLIKRQLVNEVIISFDYGWLGKMENELRQSPYPVQSIDYAEAVQITTYVEPVDLLSFEEWITNLTNGQALIIIGNETYLELDVPPTA
ncbi:YigZ family protein [Alkalicoccobacillus murimartini]|uniref:YigZ family protein n=1 Tax=Alkalicoccobacillus murimartini TaxID=171685 RepID=A0ABT9YGY3_9BACI|nr:YigZ family protein [Alkalicoccobacillus murimartini]MDQ0206776.1 putative YigZ family protein [Alkalicoccobacillus murimartini]